MIQTKTLFNTSCFLLFVLFINSHTSAQIRKNNRKENFIDSVVHQVASAHIRNKNAVGISIGIFKDGKQYSYHYGEIKKGSGKLPQNSSIYDIGSVAKVFVATMLAKAVVDGKVQLQHDIRKYLPHQYANLAYEGHPVRLVDLANHTSALPQLSRDYSEATIDSVMKLSGAGLKNFYTIYIADSLLKDMHHFSVDTLPGTKYRYNGNGMNVLVMLLERIYRQPFEVVLKHFLQTRFGMHHTQLILSSSEEKQLVQGYENGVEQPYVNFSGYRAAPGLNSTTIDMLKFIQANIEETDAAIKLSHKPTFSRSDSSGIGLGWMMERKSDGSRMIYHSGRGSGVTTLCTVHPEKRIGFIIFVNDGSSEGKLFEMEEVLMKGLERKNIKKASFAFTAPK